MAESYLNATLQFTNHLLKSMIDGLFVLNQEGLVTSANREAASVVGCELETLIGQHYTAFWPKELPSPVDMALSGESPRQATLTRFRDRPIPVTVTVGPVISEPPGSRLVSMTGLADIERLNDALAQTQKLASIGTMTASIAQELNTPINVITTTCGNLLHDVDGNSLSSERLQHYVEMIESSAWRCAQIVTVLGNYTVDDTLQMTVTDLNMIIEETVAMVQHQFRSESNVEVELDLCQDPRSIVCDHNRITQVLINLLANARDALPLSGGGIRIRSWPLDGSQNEPAETEGEANLLAFSVADTGDGIPPEVIDSIFDPFFTTKRSGSGTGLGLYIAKRIVSQHHGRIWAENNPDVGATFTVVLPQQQQGLARE